MLLVQYVFSIVLLMEGGRKEGEGEKERMREEEREGREKGGMEGGEGEKEREG